ncbi:MAG: metal-dependent phosphohydrolase, partial [Desulfobulbus sp.]|nr:metal-dependent phosphohydrolase [Desulfobulbus sp.]
MFAAIREVFGWPDLFLGLAVVLAGLAGAMLLRSRESRPPDTREIALGELAAGWTKSPVHRTVHIADLVHLWRDERLARVEVETLAVAHPRAAAFLRQLDDWPFFRACPEEGAVCRQLVQLLDREGDCPSVVDVRGDVEAAWEANTY